MLESIAQSTSEAIKHTSLLAYFLVFLGGLLTGFSPCVLPFFPVVIGYVAEQATDENYTKTQGFLLSIAFVLGFAFIFTIVGAFASFLGGIFNRFNRFWYIAVGLHFMKIYQLNLSSPFSKIQIKKPKRKGIIGAVILGVLLGLVLSPCATPVVAVILSYVLAKGNVLFGASLLFAYSIAHGLPLIIVGTSAGALAAFSKTERWRKGIEIVSGALFVLLGFYFFWLA
jgi:cytochrome c-type biogenesis protein